MKHCRYKWESCELWKVIWLKPEEVFKAFEPIADIMLNDGIVRSFLFAPDGIVKGVFPMYGNESVYDWIWILRGRETWRHRVQFQRELYYWLVPFDLVEGGIGICGRMPIYLLDGSGEKKILGYCGYNTELSTDF